MGCTAVLAYNGNLAAANKLYMHWMRKKSQDTKNCKYCNSMDVKMKWIELDPITTTANSSQPKGYTLAL
eukprot:1152365-Pelagomonas_calceolata.AAC.1